MGFLLRASLGFAIAFALYAPATFATYLPLKRFALVKTDLAAAHPGVRLQATLQAVEHRSGQDV